jgi:hypothetical protein
MDAILLDSSKAFDKVPHQRLLDWIEDFLSERTQRVLETSIFFNAHVILLAYSLFRASGYFGQRIISLVIEAVKHLPFYI